MNKFRYVMNTMRAALLHEHKRTGTTEHLPTMRRVEEILNLSDHKLMVWVSASLHAILLEEAHASSPSKTANDTTN